MSYFDRNTTSEYVEALRVFLGLNKKTFLLERGFIQLIPAKDAEGNEITDKDGNPVLVPGVTVPRKDDAGKVMKDEEGNILYHQVPRSAHSGRLPKYLKAPIYGMEHDVNLKSARCEAADSTFGERMRLARDYLGMSDAELARARGVSREVVRRWGENINRPSNRDGLASVLNVPLLWLEEGGEQNLPANSHLGMRVGDEALLWREQLYGMTQALLDEVPEDAEESYVQAFIEREVFARFDLARAARRCAGRWQFRWGSLHFAPWIPLPEQELTKRLWSDEVEAIIEDELSTKHSVYGAYEAMKKRCVAMGLSEGEYPQRISLHKRMEKQRARTEKYGVDLNDTINAALTKYPH